jgi:CDP-diacylglycerol---glycerol-3-phosphate 3-phosphatidyltransferase
MGSMLLEHLNVAEEASAAVVEPIDLASSVILACALTVSLGTYVVSSVAAGRPLLEARVQREAALPLVGRTPMHAVYRALVPLGRALASLGVTANAVSVGSLVIAAAAAVAFATGHFGLAAAIACVASLADGLDGLIARITNTKSRFGQVLDTTIDRFVDALFLGGIAVHVRESVPLLIVTLAAIVGSFMVSYASSVERELGVTGAPGAMRRAHRLVYLIGASALAPLAAHAFDDVPDAGLVPVVVAVSAIAIVGNVSAVRRLLRAARVATSASASRRPAQGSWNPHLAAEARAPVEEHP